MSAYLLLALASVLLFSAGYVAGRRPARRRPPGRHRHDPTRSNQLHVAQLLATAMVM